MILEAEAVDFVDEMSQATGVNVAIGVNTFIENIDPFTQFTVLIDPSGLSGDDEVKLEDYCENRNLRVVEAWNDWGRFLKISKLRTVSVSAFSP
jgi:hypothetical protein